MVTEVFLFQEVVEFVAGGDVVLFGDEAQAVVDAVVLEKHVQEEAGVAFVLLDFLEQCAAEFRRGSVQRNFDVQFLEELVLGVGEQHHVLDAELVAVLGGIVVFLAESRLGGAFDQQGRMNLHVFHEGLVVLAEQRESMAAGKIFQGEAAPGLVAALGIAHVALRDQSCHVIFLILHGFVGLQGTVDFVDAGNVGRGELLDLEAESVERMG